MKIFRRFSVSFARFKLCLAVKLVSSVNRQQANAFALWDDAQNAMERCCPNKPCALDDLARKFQTLSHRASERSEDVAIELGFRDRRSSVRAA